MLILAVLLAAFLLGSIPTGVLVARAKGVDLRKVGSGNIGATNVSRALGRKWATFVLVVDAGKGALPVLVCGQWLAEPWLPALSGLAAVFGHVFSIFLRGRGGKGVATSLGAGMALAPLPTLLCLCTFVVLYAAFRIVSIGSLFAVACYPLFLWLLQLGTPPRLVFAVVVAALVIVRHKANLGRLLRGEEHRA
ncbi:MAG: glycerol-3-phosphate 1-O-acyltransferase PlsY [Deltaproteobacteria bacterium]|nr:glycerol-3-phosphate 1-O-acyltransferase PlsY [Deltaproteobacteria bacterium]